MNAFIDNFDHVASQVQTKLIEIRTGANASNGGIDRHKRSNTSLEIQRLIVKIWPAGQNIGL